MFKMLTACTAEIDDTTQAVAEVLSQLDLPNALGANTIGLLSCYPEFIDTGVVRALCDALPFDVIGSTTLASAVPGTVGQLLLTLTVLTGDEVSFSTVFMDAMPEEEETLAAEYDRACGTLAAPPVLMLGAVSILRDMTGDRLLTIFDSASGGVPFFGTVAMDHTRRHLEARIIHNGGAYDTGIAFVIVSGIAPTFLLASASHANIRSQPAVITDSEGTLLRQVNGVPVLKYLQQLGLTMQGGRLAGIDAIPFVLDCGGDDIPISRTIFDITPEGYAVCGGEMPQGATLSVGFIDRDDVLATAENLATEIRKHKPRGALIFSCLARNIALGTRYSTEMERLEALLDGTPYFFSYSGGELCPIHGADGRDLNRFHNGTIIACLL